MTSEKNKGLEPDHIPPTSGTVYDNNLQSKHGPSGQKQTHPGPYGGKDNQRQLSTHFPGEAQVKPIDKPQFNKGDAH